MNKSKISHWYTDWKFWLSAFLIMTILPYLLLIFATFPLPGDDFVFSLSARQAWETTGRLIPTIQAAWQHTINIYQGWQGSLSGVFIMALSPIIFSITAYRITLLFFNLLFIVGIFCTSGYFIRKYIDLPKSYACLISSIIVFSCYHFMPSLFEFLYWYNGSSYYLFPLTLSLFASVLLHKTIRTEKPAVLSWILLSLASIFIGLNNLPLLMTVFSLLFFTTVFLFVKKSKKKYTALLLLVLLTASMLINLTAPGNFNRMTYEKSANVSLVKTIIISFYLSIKDFALQFGRLTFVPLFLVLLTPALKKNIDPNQAKSINPLILLAISYLVIASQYTVTVYTSGDANKYGRVADYRYVLYQIAIVINYLNLLAHQKKRRKEAPSKPIAENITRLTIIGFVFYAIVAAMLSFRFFFMYPSNPIDLYKQATTHQIKTYYDEQVERFDIAKTSSAKDIVFEKLTYTNSMIGFETLTNDPEYSINKNYAEFFHLNSVTVQD